MSSQLGQKGETAMLRLKKMWNVFCMAGSNMKCIICGGWGGEWGSAKNGRSICVDCWNKGNR